MSKLKRILICIPFWLLLPGGGVLLGLPWGDYVDQTQPPGEFRFVLKVAPILVLVFLGFGVPVWWIFRPVFAVWSAFAKQHGFRFQAGYLFRKPVIEGEVDGTSFWISTETDFVAPHVARNSTVMEATRTNVGQESVLAAIKSSKVRKAIKFSGLAAMPIENGVRLWIGGMLESDGALAGMKNVADAVLAAASRSGGARTSSDPSQ